MSNMAVLCSFAKTPDRLTTTVHEKLQLGNRICSAGATAAQTHFRIQLQRCEFSGRRLFLLQAPCRRVTKAAWGGDAGIGMRTPSMGTNNREEESKRTIEQELQGAQVETVVIVGAGLAGLATALALHRVGVRAVVLEQAESLRTDGTSLTLFPNAWRALDALGVAQELRPQFINIMGPHEVRAVERKVLLETLAKPLPTGTIKFAAKVKKICKPRGPKGITEVELENGMIILTKVLVGCDGGNSVVAKWMGFSQPRPVGQVTIRGISEYRNGHTFDPVVHQIMGQGTRAGIVPVSQTKVYWFVLFNASPSVPKIISDPDKVKEEALNYMQGWPVDIQECIEMTPLSCFSRGVILDRWSIPFMTPQQEMNGVTLAGDASHPMTPNLGQGGCTALEDSIVLVRKLYQVLKLELSKPTDEDFSLEHTGIGAALADYQSERWPRTFGLTVKSYIFGALLGWDLGLICFIRDNIALPFMFRASAVLGHSKFDCGQLPSPP
ncbi:unnamed protein product [Sphagnum jensenii]|uniref:Uncharacterized protein n=2 Tax=Sphagnum jensenii TaxID=128206 RepID=A0ABP0X1F8_9BRYO